MKRPTVPVDPFNPGQVFACLGFMEVAERIIGPTRAAFDWSDGPETLFALSTSEDVDPFARVLGFLAGASVRILVPADSELSGKKWKVEDEVAPSSGAFPQPEPDAPASLPAVLEYGNHRVTVEAWGDATRRDNVKFWAGAGGYPGAALLRDALELVEGQIETAREDPFSLASPQSSSLRFDWRRDYVPLGIGFSLNEHGKIVSRGYPLVEVLAAIGLNHARPQRPQRSNKLLYRYGILGGAELLPAMFHRAGLGCAQLPFPTRCFTIALDWPGQENQARCITSVTED